MAANGEVARRYFHRLAILTGAHMCNCLIGNLPYLELPVLIISIRCNHPGRPSASWSSWVHLCKKSGEWDHLHEDAQCDQMIAGRQISYRRLREQRRSSEVQPLPYPLSPWGCKADRTHTWRILLVIICVESISLAVKFHILLKNRLMLRQQVIDFVCVELYRRLNWGTEVL